MAKNTGISLESKDMTQEKDAQAYRERRAEEFFSKIFIGEDGLAYVRADIPPRNAYRAGFGAGRDLGELQGMVKALETVLSTNPYSPLVQRTATEARELLLKLLKSGEK